MHVLVIEYALEPWEVDDFENMDWEARALTACQEGNEVISGSIEEVPDAS